MGKATPETVVFLLTDIEGSTQQWDLAPEAMEAAVTRHFEVLSRGVQLHGGRVFKTVGDGVCAVFRTAGEAVAAALGTQRDLRTEAWEGIPPLRVRMALHAGAAEEREGDYLGPPVNRCARLLAAGHGGQVLLSSSAAELARDVLPSGASLRDLGQCQLRGLQSPERVSQLVHAELPGQFPPLRGVETFPDNLPVQATSLVGRQSELEELARLAPTARLLTLTGTAGVGKTRLALELGARLLPEFPDGVWLVALETLGDGRLVPQAVAAALGVQETPSQPLADALLLHLRDKALLLIVDNAEHLIETAAEMIGQVLRSCPEVRVLVASREVLGLPEETTWRVPPLALPQPEGTGGEWSPQSLGRCDAVRLFVERTAAAQPGFELTEANGPVVVQICRRLDGIPLAIELAAARMRTMALQAVSARLSDRFQLLSGGRRSSTPRQQTLQALLDWSYDLLTEEERTVFRRLAAFAGGWMLEGAEGIVGGDGVERRDVLNLLTGLVNKSLVVYENEGQGRYRLLGTLREYALAKLADSAEGPAVRSQHAHYFLEAVEREGLGESAHALIEREQDNLLGALDWARGREDGVELELRLVTALSGFWCARGPLSVGRRYTEEALARAEAGGSALRAAAYRAAGQCAYWQSDLRAARAHIVQSLALCREVGDESGVAASSNVLAGVALAEGATGESESLALEALETMRRHGDSRGAADSLAILMAAARHRGDLAAARGYAEQAVAAARDADYPWMIAHCTKALGLLAWRVRDYGAAEEAFARYGDMVQGSDNWFDIATALNALACMARLRGEYPRAGALFRDSLAKSQAAGSPDLVANVQSNLGHLAWCEGDLAEARRLHLEALTTALGVGELHTATLCIVRMAVLLCSEGAWRRAATLFGAVGGLRGTNLGPFMPPDQDVYEQCDAQAREALGEAEFTEAIRAGRAMGLNEALAFARAS
jgi:predicted ATPase/class 3 adenylate cyclase